jgi:hypothetical protein
LYVFINVQALFQIKKLYLESNCATASKPGYVKTGKKRFARTRVLVKECLRGLATDRSFIYLKERNAETYSFKMHFTPLLFALLAVVSADDSTLLEFDPPLLTMKTASAIFKVRMTKSPSANAPASVYFVQPGFQFSNCFLNFNADNYNVSQEIEIAAAPSFSKNNKKADIDVEICVPDTDYTNLKDKYTVKPKQYPAATCKSTGGILNIIVNNQIHISIHSPARSSISREKALTTW